MPERVAPICITCQFGVQACIFLLKVDKNMVLIGRIGKWDSADFINQDYPIKRDLFLKRFDTIGALGGIFIRVEIHVQTSQLPCQGKQCLNWRHSLNGLGGVGVCKRHDNWDMSPTQRVDEKLPQEYLWLLP